MGLGGATGKIKERGPRLISAPFIFFRCGIRAGNITNPLPLSCEFSMSSAGKNPNASLSCPRLPRSVRPKSTHTLPPSRTYTGVLPCHRDNSLRIWKINPRCLTLQTKWPDCDIFVGDPLWLPCLPTSRHLHLNAVRFLLSSIALYCWPLLACQWPGSIIGAEQLNT